MQARGPLMVEHRLIERMLAVIRQTIGYNRADTVAARFGRPHDSYPAAPGRAGVSRTRPGKSKPT
jgi:hypothetical protein